MEHHRFQLVSFLSVCFQHSISECRFPYYTFALCLTSPKKVIDGFFRINMIKGFSVHSISLEEGAWQCLQHFKMHSPADIVVPRSYPLALLISVLTKAFLIKTLRWNSRVERRSLVTEEKKQIVKSHGLFNPRVR